MCSGTSHENRSLLTARTWNWARSGGTLHRHVVPGTDVLLSSLCGDLPDPSPLLPTLSQWMPRAGEINFHLSVPGTNGSFVVMEVASACFRPQHDGTHFNFNLVAFFRWLTATAVSLNVLRGVQIKVEKNSVSSSRFFCSLYQPTYLIIFYDPRKQKENNAFLITVKRLYVRERGKLWLIFYV